MDIIQIKKVIDEFLKDSGLNIIAPDVALAEEAAGLTIYDPPLVAVASAENEYLCQLKINPEANIKLEPPKFWLPEAQSVVSIFLPYCESIRKSNVGGIMPSFEWLNGRKQGQEFIIALLKHLQMFFADRGYDAVIPILDDRYWDCIREFEEKDFTSNWSERHVAYAAGLGTFSLSKGLITEKGIAGRFASIVTTAMMEPTIPKYKDLYEYCIMCGTCADKCPVLAISKKDGKKHKPCSDVLQEVEKKYPPYQGCGKCQVGVPCESEIPIL